MTNECLINTLRSLRQLDGDVLEAYESVLERLKGEQIQHNILAFRDDYIKRIKEITHQITKLEANQPALINDPIKNIGFQFPTLKYGVDLKDVLKALKRIAAFIYRQYHQNNLNAKKAHVDHFKMILAKVKNS
jgi:hypothetical protein